MSVTIEWRGMNDFIQALKNAPVEINAEADVVTRAAANDMAASIRRQYRNVSTTFLAGQVKNRKLATRVYRVRVGGHAHIYELGSGVRHTKAGADRGQMPAKGPIFIPTEQVHRHRMEAQCQAIAQKSRTARSTMSGLL